MPLIEDDKLPDVSRVNINATSTRDVPPEIRSKNRRKRWLDLHHEEYFGPQLELADPLLYDRLIRRFQTPGEREAEGRAKGYSGVLEADIVRSEAKLAALQHPDPAALYTYKRGANGEIFAEDKDEVPTTKEEGWMLWRDVMEQRFLRGGDTDFEYEKVDGGEEWDDVKEEEREEEERWFDSETPEPVEGGRVLSGETGVQDF